jgi:hypothetical protein
LPAREDTVNRDFAVICYYCAKCGSVVEVEFDRVTAGELGEEVLNFNVTPCNRCVEGEDVDLTPKSDPDSLVPAVEVTASEMGVVELVFEKGTPIELARIVHNHLTQKFVNMMVDASTMEAMRAVSHDLLMGFVHEGRLRRGLRGWEFDGNSS